MVIFHISTKQPKFLFIILFSITYLTVVSLLLKQLIVIIMYTTVAGILKNWFGQCQSTVRQEKKCV